MYFGCSTLLLNLSCRRRSVRNTMAESPPQQTTLATPAPSAWAARNPRKNTGRVQGSSKKYAESTKGNEFITMPEAFEAIAPRTISLLTTVSQTFPGCEGRPCLCGRGGAD